MVMGLGYVLIFNDPRNPLTFLVLLGLFVPMLVHAAHRFRYTLYDGLQVKHKIVVAMLCYGGAAVIATVAFYHLAKALELLRQ